MTSGLVKYELRFIILLLKRIMIVVGIYQLARIYFFVTNSQIFSDVSFFDFIKCSLVGLQFDLNAIVSTNIIFILLHILPFQIRSNRYYQLVCKILFYFVNSLAFVVMISDAEYYKFTRRHATVELADFMDEFLPLLSSYLVSYWFIVPIFIFFIFLIEYLYRRTNSSIKNVQDKIIDGRSKLIQVFLFLMACGFCFIAIRGSFSKYSLSPSVAGRYVKPTEAPIVINTPFSIIYSLFHKKLTPVSYFTDGELKDQFQYIKYPSDSSYQNSTGHQPTNIMIIVMESFSAEYTFLYGKENSATPFLDSLAKRSMYFTRMYANATRSVDGIPAIVAGIPAKMDESFISSVYQSNNYMGLPAYLTKKGYSSSFFHGGENGTFNLDLFSYNAGFQNYYGLNEFNGSKSDISHWGVDDEPFFLFTANKMNEMKPPFISLFFSLSSHHPYAVPASYSKSHPQNTNEVLNSVQYADYSLKVFFDRVKNEEWYKNTLFVITADHCGPALNSLSEEKINRLHIPLVLFHPTDTFFNGKIDYPVQQIDILPTILDYLHFNEPYVSFGTSVFNKQTHYTYTNFAGKHYVTDHTHLLELYNEKAVGLFRFKSDYSYEDLVLEQNADIGTQLELKHKAFMQVYTNALIQNKMVYQQ